jgi:hypothetical protein
MVLQKTLTVTLTTHGDVDQPCVAQCPGLALATDGPTVPAALHALARAIEIYDDLGQPAGSDAPAGATNDGAAAPDVPSPENHLRPVAAADRPRKAVRPEGASPAPASSHERTRRTA